MPRHKRTALVCILALAAACAALPGCNIVGPVLMFAKGPPKVPKAYDLDKNRSTVILVDDLGSRLPRARLRAVIAETAEMDMLKHKVVKDLISSTSAFAVTARETADELVFVRDVGRQLGADVVVNVAVESFTLSMTGEEYAPLCILHVSVFDAQNDKHLWPTDERYYRMVLQPPVSTAYTPKSITEAAQAEIALAQYAGHGVAELFFEQERHRAARAGERTE